MKIESLFQFKSWEDEKETPQNLLDAVFEDEALEEAALKFQESEPVPGHISAVKSCAVVPRVRTYYRELELRAKARLRRLALSQRQGRKQQQQQRWAVKNIRCWHQHLERWAIKAGHGSNCAALNSN